MSLTTEDLMFLHSVQEAVKNKPELFSHIINSLHDGIIQKIDQHSQQASDAEVALAMLCCDKSTRKIAKKAIGFKEKIEDYKKNHRAYSRWDWLFEEKD